MSVDELANQLDVIKNKIQEILLTFKTANPQDVSTVSTTSDDLLTLANEFIEDVQNLKDLI